MTLKSSRSVQIKSKINRSFGQETTHKSQCPQVSEEEEGGTEVCACALLLFTFLAFLLKKELLQGQIHLEIDIFLGFEGLTLSLRIISWIRSNIDLYLQTQQSLDTAAK